MAWSEVLLALNSDLKKPLNELIEGQRTFGASDSPLVVFHSSSDEVHYTNNKFIGSFTPKKGGSVRLKFVSRTVGVFGSEKGFVVKKSDGTEITHYYSDSSTEFKENFVDFNIVEGETYSVYGDAVEATYLAICASIIDGSLFESEVI